MVDNNSISQDSAMEEFLRVKLLKVEDIHHDRKDSINGHSEPIVAINVKETEESPGKVLIATHLRLNLSLETKSELRLCIPHFFFLDPFVNLDHNNVATTMVI